MIYLVTYTINPARDITPIAQALQSAPAHGWWHFVDDTWLIATQEDAVQIYNRIYMAFNRTDRLLIIRIDPNAAANVGYNGWLPEEAWNWIEQHKRL